MALETVSGGAGKTLSSLSEGQSLGGFLKDVVKEKNKFNNDQWNFVMADEFGNEFKLLSGGSAKYFAQNVAMAMGKEPVNAQFAASVDGAKKCIGHWVVFTLEGSYQNKTKQTVKNYKVQADLEKKPQTSTEEIPF